MTISAGSARGEHVEQVGAVREAAGGAVARGLRRVVVRAMITRARLPVAQACWTSASQAIARTGVLEVERAQRLHRVGPERDAGADLAQLRRRLVDAHLEAAPAQRVRRGQAADAPADHCDARRSCHARCGAVRPVQTPDRSAGDASRENVTSAPDEAPDAHLERSAPS